MNHQHKSVGMSQRDKVRDLFKEARYANTREATPATERALAAATAKRERRAQRNQRLQEGRDGRITNQVAPS